MNVLIHIHIRIHIHTHKTQPHPLAVTHHSSKKNCHMPPLENRIKPLHNLIKPIEKKNESERKIQKKKLHNSRWEIIPSHNIYTHYSPYTTPRATTTTYEVKTATMAGWPAKEEMLLMNLHQWNFTLILNDFHICCHFPSYESGILRDWNAELQNNYAEKKIRTYVCTHITSKRIELEGPGWSGLVRF